MQYFTSENYLLTCSFVCLGGRKDGTDCLDYNALQRVGIPSFSDLAKCFDKENQAVLKINDNRLKILIR